MNNLKKFYNHLNKIHHLKSSQALLHWDEQVNLPPDGAPFRADVLATVASVIHEVESSDELWDLVNLLTHEQLNADDSLNVTLTRRNLERARKLPSSFVVEKSRVTSEAFHTWIKARPANDFAAVKPYLERIFKLARDEAGLIGYEGHPYNALLDEYERDGKIELIKPLLEGLSSQLKALINKITATPVPHRTLTKTFSIEDQRKVCDAVSKKLGFLDSFGRLDTAAHPFQSTIGTGDARITTRWSEKEPLSALYGVIHEIGHALYELGLPAKWAGTPRGSSVSLGVHESQSRFWENVVGRSFAFCQFLSPLMKTVAPSSPEASPADLWCMANQVTPSLIRVEADEVTYSLHIVVRMLLEIQLVEGTLSVSDLPDAWNTLYEEHVGDRPKDFRDGVLQDVHWFGGSVGYFPTYALGNIYGAMLTEKMVADIGDIEQRIIEGEFLDILNWLRTNVHSKGSMLSPQLLVSDITGMQVSEKPFVAYLERKFLLNRPSV